MWTSLWPDHVTRFALEAVRARHESVTGLPECFGHAKLCAAGGEDFRAGVLESLLHHDWAGALALRGFFSHDALRAWGDAVSLAARVPEQALRDIRVTKKAVSYRLTVLAMDGPVLQRGNGHECFPMQTFHPEDLGEEFGVPCTAIGNALAATSSIIPEANDPGASRVAPGVDRRLRFFLGGNMRQTTPKTSNK